jgi:anti-sigma-K factor RskA
MPVGPRGGDLRYADESLLEHLASTYVLGTLRHGARRRFERLRRERADVDLRVAQWEERLGLLAQSIPAIRPGSHVWRAIDGRTRPSAVSAVRRGGGWRKLSGNSLGALAGGFALAMVLVFAAPALFFSADRMAMLSGEKLPQSYVGLLTDAQGTGKLLVSSLRHGRTMTVKVLSPIEPAGAGARLVLWALPAEGAPFVIGEVPASGSAQSQLPDTSEKLLSNVRKLVVTRETSAHPAVPGTVVYTGNCAKLW